MMVIESFDVFLIVCATVCETILIILAIQTIKDELIKTIKDELKDR